MNSRWFEIDEAFIPAQSMVTTLLDLVLPNQASSHRLLSKTGIFYEDLTKRDCLLTPDKCLRLITKCEQAYTNGDLAFRLGQRIFPGFHGAFSQAITSAATVRQALVLLQCHGQKFSPLLVPRVNITEHFAEVRWYPAFSLGDAQQFLSEVYLSALTQGFNAFTSSKLPWEYNFRYAVPVELESYEVHFGERLCFGRPVTRMLLPSSVLDRPFTTASELNFEHAVSELRAEGIRKMGFLFYLRDLLYRQVSVSPTLESIAYQLSTSSATLKRKLRKNRSGFRQLLDEVRMEAAVDLVENKGFNNGQVAAYLGFYDEANYRRSFKRWTGINPSEYGYLSLQGVFQ